MSHFLPRLLFPAVANPGSLTDNDTHNFRALPLSFEIAGSPKLLLQKLELCEALLMRHSLARTLNVVLFLFAFLVPVSFFGQNQGPKKPTRSSGKTGSETVLQADDLAGRVADGGAARVCFAPPPPIPPPLTSPH